MIFVYRNGRTLRFTWCSQCFFGILLSLFIKC